MAHFALIHPGGWLSGYVVTTTDFQTIDSQLSACLHEGGGTWAAATTIIIGGAGMTISAPFHTQASAVFEAGFASNGASLLTAPVTVSGTFHTQASTVFEVGFASNGSSLITAPLTISGSGSLTVSGTGGMTVNGGAFLSAVSSIFSGAASFTGATASFSAGTTTTLAGPVVLSSSNVSGNPTFTGGPSFAGTVNLGGPVSVDSTLTYVGSGHAVQRKRAGADSNAGYGINDADFVVAQSLSNDWAYTISNTGCTGGEQMTFVNENILHTITLKQADGTTPIATGPVTAVLKNVSGSKFSVTIWNDGSGSASTAWHVLSFCVVP